MTANRALQRATAPNVFEAFRRVVYGYGVERLAAATGHRPGTLYNKADADDTGHHQPTLRDVLLVTQATGDMAILDALDETFGRAAYCTAQHETTSDEALLDLMANLGAESGQFHGAIAHGLRSRRFTPELMRQVRGEAFDLISAVMALTTRLEGLVDRADE